MKLIKVNIKPLKNIFVCNYSSKTSYNIENFPYTAELYKKNYIKYQTLSKQGVIHDYVYHGDERLPNLKTRMKGYIIIIFAS